MYIKWRLNFHEVEYFHNLECTTSPPSVIMKYVNAPLVVFLSDDFINFMILHDKAFVDVYLKIFGCILV